MLYVEYWDTEDRAWRLAKLPFWKAIIAVLTNKDCSFAKVIKGKDITVVKMSHPTTPPGEFR